MSQQSTLQHWKRSEEQPERGGTSSLQPAGAGGPCPQVSVPIAGSATKAMLSREPRGVGPPDRFSRTGYWRSAREEAVQHQPWTGGQAE